MVLTCTQNKQRNINIHSSSWIWDRFSDDLMTWDYIARLTAKWMNDELQRMWYEAVVTYLKAISWRNWGKATKIISQESLVCSYRDSNRNTSPKANSLSLCAPRRFEFYVFIERNVQRKLTMEGSHVKRYETIIFLNKSLSQKSYATAANSWPHEMATEGFPLSRNGVRCSIWRCFKKIERRNKLKVIYIMFRFLDDFLSG